MKNTWNMELFRNSSYMRVAYGRDCVKPRTVVIYILCRGLGGRMQEGTNLDSCSTNRLLSTKSISSSSWAHSEWHFPAAHEAGHDYVTKF